MRGNCPEREQRSFTGGSEHRSPNRGRDTESGIVVVITLRVVIRDAERDGYCK